VDNFSYVTFQISFRILNYCYFNILSFQTTLIQGNYPEVDHRTTKPKSESSKERIFKCQRYFNTDCILTGVEGQAASAMGEDGMVADRYYGVCVPVDGSKRKEAGWTNPAPGFRCGGGHKERGMCLQPQSHSFVGRGTLRRMAGDCCLRVEAVVYITLALCKSTQRAFYRESPGPISCRGESSLRNRYWAGMSYNAHYET